MTDPNTGMMPHDVWDLDRRSLIGRIGLLIGAAALPADLFAAAPARRAKRFLAPSVYKLVQAVSDTMVPVTDTPGALAAKVPENIDGLMAKWASAESRATLMSAFAAIDKASLASDKVTFAALSPERRKAVLTAHDLDAMKQVPRKEKLTGLAALMAAPSVADPGYAKLKDLILSLYYASEIGLTKELVYEHAPGKWVPSLKITPETRPFAGGGPF